MPRIDSFRQCFNTPKRNDNALLFSAHSSALAIIDYSSSSIPDPWATEVITRSKILAQSYRSTFERRRRQRSEQYFTSSLYSAHFWRQVKGRPQTGQFLEGRSDFER